MGGQVDIACAEYSRAREWVNRMDKVVEELLKGEQS